MSSPQYDPQLGDMAERKNRGGPFVRCLQRRLQTEATERAQLERLLQKYPTTEGGS